MFLFKSYNSMYIALDDNLRTHLLIKFEFKLDWIITTQYRTKTHDEKPIDYTKKSKAAKAYTVLYRLMYSILLSKLL